MNELIVIFVVLVFGGFGYYLFTKHSDKRNDNTKPNPEDKPKKDKRI